MDLRNVAIKKIILLSLITSTYSCGILNTTSESVHYAETSGLVLEFNFKKNKSGYLRINNEKDSIPFLYNCIKEEKKLFHSKKDKLINTTIYNYFIDYQGNKYLKHEILRNYDTLISLTRYSKIIYKSHN